VNPYLIIRTSLTRVVSVKLVQDQPYVNGTIRTLIYEAPISSNEKSFEVLALESVGHNIFSISKTIDLTSCHGDVSFMTSIIIPNWVKKVGGYWARGEISDGEFVRAIQYLISHEIIIVPSVSFQGTSNDIPTWIKNNAGLWAEGQISDNEFVKGIQYLMSNGIMSIS